MQRKTDKYGRFMRHIKDDGSPYHMTIYQRKKNPTVDCMTIVFHKPATFCRDSRYKGKVWYVGACVTGNAFYQHGEADSHSFCPGGSKVKWIDVTSD